MVWPGDVFGIVLAVVLGAVIGVEREFSGKAAGLRTNILICLGAAVFTIISQRMACGGGLYELALISTLIAIFVLIGLRLIHRSLRHYIEKNKPIADSDEQTLTIFSF